MMLIKNIILSALFVSVSCYESKNINLSQKIPPITHTDMAQLFELCFANTSNPIAITENLVETFQKNLSFTIKAPVIIINENFISKDIQLYYPTYPMYILSVSSYGEMLGLLRKLVDLPFWSQQSIFFVIYETVKACERSWEMIQVLWYAELLSCIIVCSRTGNATSLYTYNPYTRRAPNPWVEVNFNLFDLRRRPLTLYNQSFSNDHKICETLLFDKTKFLDGYPGIIASDTEMSPPLFNYTFTALNMTPQVMKSKIELIYSAVITGVCDISSLHSRFIDPGYVQTSPVITEYSYIIVTKKANYLSAVDQIAHVFDINGAIAIIFLLLLITLLIVLHNKYQIGLAFLDVLKLLMSMGIDAPLDRLAMKITFFTGFLFVFIFSPLLEGQIFAILSRPPTYNIESLKDLYDHKYYVYCPEAVSDYIIEEQLWKTDEDMKYLHFEPQSDYHVAFDCLKQVIENNKVACIFLELIIIDAAVKLNLHISKRFVLKISGFTQARPFWALVNRFNHKLLNTFELGIKLTVWNKLRKISKKKLRAEDRLKRIVDYQEIDAVDLTYLYVFMGFFQFLAVIVFGIEYIVGRHRRPRQ